MTNDGWTECLVEDIKARGKSALATGPFGSAISARFFQPTGVPVIRGSNLSQDIGHRLIEDGLAYVSEDKAREFERSVVRHGDLVFTCWGTIDQVGLIDGRCKYREYVVSNKQMKLTPDPDKGDSLFLYYLFSGAEMRTTILNQGIGSSVPGFNLGQFRSLKLRLPPLPEQKAIAHILGTLDDKIELNRQMNETLEATARALFKSWFVDFDPVRAKLNGQKPVGMDEQTAALFPSAFSDSPEGKIPTGWRFDRLSEVVEVNPAQIGKDYPYSEIEYVDISSVTVGRLGETTHHTLKDAPSRAKRLVCHGDTIWSCVRPNRKSFLFIHRPAENLVVSTGFAVLSPKAVPPAYLYEWVTTDDFVDHLTRNAHGSAYPAVRADTFERADVLLPPAAVLEAFERAVSPMLDGIAHNERESRTLALVRDTLLPRLLSGEIRVPEAKALLEGPL